MKQFTISQKLLRQIYYLKGNYYPNYTSDVLTGTHALNLTSRNDAVRATASLTFANGDQSHSVFSLISSAPFGAAPSFAGNYELFIPPGEGDLPVLALVYLATGTRRIRAGGNEFNPILSAEPENADRTDCVLQSDPVGSTPLPRTQA